MSLPKPEIIDLPAFDVLATTGRGMDNGNMERAARQGFDELFAALGPAGVMDRVASCLAIMADKPRGPDDQDARMLCGVVFDLDLASPGGTSARPGIALTGTLAWHVVPAGRHARFVHVGPYAQLHGTWSAIERDWPASAGNAARGTPPFEHYVNDPGSTPPEQLITHIYIPVA